MSFLHRDGDAGDNMWWRNTKPNANSYGVTFGYGYTDGFTFGNDHSHRNALTNAYLPTRKVRPGRGRLPLITHSPLSQRLLRAMARSVIQQAVLPGLRLTRFTGMTRSRTAGPHWQMWELASTMRESLTPQILTRFMCLAALTLTLLS